MDARGHRVAHHPARLVLVDDQAAPRLALRSLLRDQAGLKIVGEAAEAQTAIDLVRRLQPDMVVVDMQMPGMDGTGLTLVLKAEPRAPRVLVMTVDPSPSGLLACLTAGADGCLLKGSPRTHLMRVIRDTLKGGPLMCPEVATYLMETVRSSADGRPSMFDQPPTEVDLQLLTLCAAGLDRQQIARELRVRPGLVPVHVRQVLDKLKAPSG